MFKLMNWTIFIISLLHLSNSAEIKEPFFKNLNTSYENLTHLADRISKQYAIDYIDFIKTGEESLALRDLNKQLLIQRSNASWAHGFRNATIADKLLACIACRTVVQGAAHIIKDSNSQWVGIDKERYVQRFFLDLCKVYNILQQDVCKGLFRQYWPSFEYMIQSKKSFDERIFCNRLGIKFCYIKPPAHNWVLTLNDDLRNISETQTNKASAYLTTRILHITDIHYDPDYKVGALANCEEPLCCHNMHKEASKGVMLAEFWGDYHFCDAPLRMIESAFNHMRRTHQDIQYIYQTGDVLAHIGWSTNKADIIEMFSHMDKLMTEKFPDVPVFPCIGNNDVYPKDFASPSDVPEPVNTKWLYEYLFSIWSKYLPPSTRETVLKGGYYTVSPHVGFRIISLNSNECRLNNFWLYFNTSFAVEQLQWLHDTLMQAEQAQEYVHILSHMPIGSTECWKPWSHEYFRIIARFQHLIKGIFYGHTHGNDMSVHYDDSGNVVAVAWHGGSLTPFLGRNPSYRVYEAESKTMQIIDHETWTFNLSLANFLGANRDPNWFRLSQFTVDFTRNLSPMGIVSLLEQMATNPDLLRKYWVVKTAASDPTLAQGCDETCLQETLCGPINQESRCNILIDKLKQSSLAESGAKNGVELKTSGYVRVFLYIIFYVSCILFI